MSLNIQIFGTKKCQDTRKAERYFKERGIKYHFKDLAEFGISKGEFENIAAVIPPEELINRDGQQFKKRNLEYIKFNIREELVADALLLKTPLVRNGRKVTCGFVPEEWKKWIDESK
ncbi:MAG: ArsC family transcriptional regulator [Ignavibacteriaceae bacterium]|nr:ArsC family transcriptional regulator [Ignavibacteriaceae bacterium]